MCLLFGEVKTSSDSGTPPNVMYGRSGMNWQLQENATRIDVHHTLLRWLRARCANPEHLGRYKAAVARYLASHGSDILLIGILVRDTPPNERDIRSRAVALAQRLSPPTRVEVSACYLPIPITQWRAILQGSTS